DVAWLQGLTAHTPVDLDIYREALRHRSALHDADKGVVSNERLEFLGDAILSLVVAESLFARYPDFDEGFLTRLRSKLVNGKTLASCARRIDLGGHIQLSHNMVRTAGRDNRSILSDAFEALIGAIYLDQGIDAARRFIDRTLLQIVDLDELAQTRDNWKSLLLELSQARAWPQPTYSVIEEAGPDHDKTFTVAVSIAEKALGEGTATSKKGAEQKAARAALEHLNREISGD
ncbi:MAG: ribonuclease III, partial [Rhodothermales bacterium]|nr:ribonuclease III [Rhodothermales bacterium]